MDGTLTDSPAPAAARSLSEVVADATQEMPNADLIVVSDGAQPVVADAAGHPSGTSLLDQYLGTDAAVPASMLADLDHPDLVLTDGYVGPERRGSRTLDRLRRATFGQRRSMLRLEVVAAIVVLGAASVVMFGSVGRSTAIVDRTGGQVTGSGHRAPAVAAGVAARQASSTATTPAAAAAPSATTPVATTPTTPAAPAPAPATAPPVSAPASVPAPTAAAPQATPTTALTPVQMGAQALALVRYPWQRIPGYNIQFLPISQAPSPGFYGNTTFTWGRPGGTSVMYVYPGETVEHLAGITAFEIGHEVDAAGVQPQGGETQIENVLGIHPSSWAPNCDCAEQGFLSGWYSAAFSNYWSPGVGNWSTIAPEPTGSVLAAIQTWLNPAIS